MTRISWVAYVTDESGSLANTGSATRLGSRVRSSRLLASFRPSSSRRAMSLTLATIENAMAGTGQPSVYRRKRRRQGAPPVCTRLRKDLRARRHHGVWSGRLDAGSDHGVARLHSGRDRPEPRRVSAVAGGFRGPDGVRDRLRPRRPDGG